MEELHARISAPNELDERLGRSDSPPSLPNRQSFGDGSAIRRCRIGQQATKSELALPERRLPE